MYVAAAQKWVGYWDIMRAMSEYVYEYIRGGEFSGRDG